MNVACPCQAQLLHRKQKRLARIELAISAWQADGLPLHHRRVLNFQIVKDQERRSVQRAPSRNRTRITSLRRRRLAVRPSVLVFFQFSVGPVGIEPTSFGLRDRCITLSATIPFLSFSRRGRNRTFDLRLIRTLLQPLSYTPQIKVRSERFELSPTWVKARDASATPQPQMAMVLRFKRSGNDISSLQ